MESIVLQASIVKIKMWLNYRKEQKSFCHIFFFLEVVVTPYPVLHMEPQKVQYQMKRDVRK